MGESGPRILGRYEIQEEIGRGMMGVVYRALDPALGRTVALKTVNLLLAVPDEDRPGFEQRFLNEARVAAGLNHPGIVVVHDVGRDSGSDSLYIALEYLEGETLSERVKREGRLEWREALRLTARVAEALHHAHGKHIVHRDVKPANIMVLPNGQPKLMDFGIAKIPAAQLTSAGEFFGTPSYMSPEQATGEPLDARSDVFSLGAVLYLLLTGVRAFDAPSVPGILARVANKDPSPPSKLTPGLPAAVDDIVARALAKDPGLRYASGLMLAEDIQDVLADRTPRHRATWNPPPPADETMRSKVPASAETPTADLRTIPSAAPPAASAASNARPHDDSLLLRLAERVGWRGAVALIALLAVGIAFPLATRRAVEITRRRDAAIRRNRRGAGDRNERPDAHRAREADARLVGRSEGNQLTHGEIRRVVRDCPPECAAAAARRAPSAGTAPAGRRRRASTSRWDAASRCPTGSAPARSRPARARTAPRR